MTTLTVRDDSDSSSVYSGVDTDPLAYDEMEYTHPWLNEERSEPDEPEDPKDPEPEAESPGSISSFSSN